MSTGSTKYANKKTRAKNSARATKKSRQSVELETVDAFPDRAWRIGVVAILLIAAVLRLYDLELVPLHHDEGVNGNFLVRLVREGTYQYDPHNYHGPTLYYFSAIIPWITKVLFGSGARDNYGMTTFTVRLVPVVFGIGTIGLVFLLRKRLGSVGTLAAGLMLAVSPGAVYLSRYYIHEMLFVFFTLAIVVSMVWFYDKRNPSYLIPAAASAALLFATKETAFISIGVILIALGLMLIYNRFINPTFSDVRLIRVSQRFKRVIEEMGGAGAVLTAVGFSVIVFLAVYLLFYSSFFTNSKGIYDSLETYSTWGETGQTAHKHPASMYFWWLAYQESPLLVLGAIGAGLAVLRAKNSFALFSGLWAFGIIAAYSLIPYKTPWLALNFIVPLALIAGYTIQTIYDIGRVLLPVALAVLLLAVGVATYQSIDLNFFNYDNDKPRFVYVYAHTTRGLHDLVKEVDRIAGQEGGNLTGITIVSPDYWPLPWYFRNYTRVGYFGRMAASTEPLIIANANQKTEADASFGAVYEQVRSSAPDGSFELRPGVRLLLYQRRADGPVTNPPSIRNP